MSPDSSQDIPTADDLVREYTAGNNRKADMEKVYLPTVGVIMKRILVKRVLDILWLPPVRLNPKSGLIDPDNLETEQKKVNAFFRDFRDFDDNLRLENQIRLAERGANVISTDRLGTP